MQMPRPIKEGHVRRHERAGNRHRTNSENLWASASHTAVKRKFALAHGRRSSRRRLQDHVLVGSFRPRRRGLISDNDPAFEAFSDPPGEAFARSRASKPRGDPGRPDAYLCRQPVKPSAPAPRRLLLAHTRRDDTVSDVLYQEASETASTAEMGAQSRRAVNVICEATDSSVEHSPVQTDNCNRAKSLQQCNRERGHHAQALHCRTSVIAGDLFFE